ncbi:MAG: disulfide bond formation protein B, partial [Lysobacteraceae bacterium]
RWSFRSQFLAGFAICAALLGYAFHVQFQLGIQPCPFCIFQRLCFATMGIVFLLGALHAPRRPGARKAWGLLAFVAGAAGMGISGRHAWVQMHPPPMPICTPSWNFLVEQNSWLGVVRKVLLANGDCSSIDWRLLGLTMPMWCLVFFVALALGGLYAGFRRRAHHMFHR